ncbi:hypothetical protein SAMN05444397_109207 [Flavobacterium aquidurense]|uniref:Lipoprotein n=1 Tax=Flavobacterium frigidimaris TaxID=262320 RepID=A0ABX4BU51_FLAFR|nr:hypothetical protein [Flavobacterium frigidimaris]OXA81083.1 hypothetical protein B0A65_04890 [Flavobacterium frigidimaris]SDZ58696.1 hypothetical protein SAMN05444397_109207 [Flavobacterium aquidurense]
MKILRKTIILLIILNFVSCKKNEDAFLFDENRFENIESLKLSDAIETERGIDSKERTYNNTFGIGTSYYPNTNNYILSYPKVYEKKQESLNLETDYFYTRNDSLMKVIFYEWSAKTDTLKTLNTTEVKAFEKKMCNLKDLISKNLGKPKVVEIEKRKDTSYNYTDRYKWLKNDLSADLYYDVSGEFKRIRLVVYKK